MIIIVTSLTLTKRAHNSFTEAWGKFHGTGEAIRGELNSFVDTLGGDSAGARRDAAVTEKGVKEMETGRFDKRDIEPTTQSDHPRRGL